MGCQLWITRHVQGPHAGPSATSIPDPPAGHPLGAGALAAAEHFGGHPQQPQRLGCPLHRALGQARIAHQAIVGGPAVTPGTEVGVAGPGLGHAHDRFE